MEQLSETAFILDKEFTLKEIQGQLAYLLGLLQPSPSSPKNSVPGFLVRAISGASTATAISAGKLLVKAALVQNISTNNVTLGGDGVVVGKGHILNKATSSGDAGDTVTIVPPSGYDAVDLSLIFFNQTGTGDTLSVFYFL